MEKIEDVVREMRKDIPRVVDAKVILRNYADRIEEAVKVLKADRDNWRKQALVDNARANATCKESLQVENWKEICKMCKDGETMPYHCEYYGEPNGCNSPTYGEHPTCEKSSQVGNAAAMREALKQIDRIVWDKRRHTKEEVEAHRLATEALTTPARNCDVYTEAQLCKMVTEEIKSEWGNIPQDILDIVDIVPKGMIRSLFAEAKGETNEQ